MQIDYNQISFLFGQNNEAAARIMKQIIDKNEIEFTSTLNVSFEMIDYKEGKYNTEGLFYEGILTYTDYSNL